MTNDVTSAILARRRADEAGVRARQLRERVDAVRAGTDTMRGSSQDDVTVALQRAERAAERLIQALESSADAHDRAADAYDEHIRRCGDPDGRRAARSALHRQEATDDRNRAAAVTEHATGPAPPCARPAPR